MADYLENSKPTYGNVRVPTQWHNGWRWQWHVYFFIFGLLKAVSRRRGVWADGNISSDEQHAWWTLKFNLLSHTNKSIGSIDIPEASCCGGVGVSNCTCQTHRIVSIAPKPTWSAGREWETSSAIYWQLSRTSQQQLTHVINLETIRWAQQNICMDEWYEEIAHRTDRTLSSSSMMWTKFYARLSKHMVGCLHFYSIIN